MSVHFGAPTGLRQIVVVTMLFLAAAARVQAHTPAEAMAEAATHFLASLSAEQRQKAQFSFDDPQRENWNFIPMERAGLPLKAMQPNQQHLAMNLLHSALSHRGFSKALNIMALEQILQEMEKGSGPKRDASMYHFYIFGEPSTSLTWGWRVEGHHLSVSVTLVDGQKVATTPSFLGANPAEVKQGAQEGLRVLRAEEDLARELLKSLSPEQREVAVLKIDVPTDIINGPARAASLLEPQGLAAKQMSQEQRKVLMALVREYVHTYRPELAREDMRKIRDSGVQNIHFAWVGSDQRGQGHYYRVQGPSFVLEYDNTQNNANHIHCVWRDVENDFGADLLKEHYEAVPHKD
jgi:hypothetical protein